MAFPYEEGEWPKRLCPVCARRRPFPEVLDGCPVCWGEGVLVFGEAGLHHYSEQVLGEAVEVALAEVAPLEELATTGLSVETRSAVDQVMGGLYDAGVLDNSAHVRRELEAQGMTVEEAVEILTAGLLDDEHAEDAAAA